MNALQEIRNRLFQGRANISVLELAIVHASGITVAEHEQAAQDLASITAENIALREIARAVTLLDDGTGMRTFPSKSLIEKARDALKQSS